MDDEPTRAPQATNDRASFLPRPDTVIRIAVAVLLGVHGNSRAWKGAVSGFGEFLSSQGFPFGLGIAWAITIFEIVGVLVLAQGRWARAVVPGFIGILLGGIVLVHAREGWFVVGGGTNGVEYSVLLIASLITIGLAAPPIRQARA